MNALRVKQAGFRGPGPNRGSSASHRVCIAPMMDCTDRHFRFLMRLITAHGRLYTEMVPAPALLHGGPERFLAFHPVEHPLALQLGGSDPGELARCAQEAEWFGYDEINLNAGCPSGRVQAGRFGACLMAEPEVVAQCVSAIRRSVLLPVTVKTRIGIDALDSFDFLSTFVRMVADAGCSTFIIHARKAWLNGLSPRENREIPPLRYDRVLRLKQQFPDLSIVINGGIRTLGEVEHALGGVDGVMVGREAYSNPYRFSEVDRKFFNDPHPVPSRESILDAYLDYVEGQLGLGVPLARMARHVLGLFQGCSGVRHWRRQVSENMRRPGAGPELLRLSLPSAA